MTTDNTFFLLAENANEGILVHQHGQFVYSNKKIAHLLGYEDTTETLKSGQVGIVHPDEYNHFSEYLENRRQGHDELDQYETVFSSKDGNRVYVEITVSNMIWQDNEAVLIMTREISKRKNIDQLTALLSKGVSQENFNDFLFECVLQLTQLYNAKFGFIGQLIGPENTHVRTLFVVDDGRQVDNFEYELEGTPCQDILNYDKELIPNNASELYKEDEMLVQMGVESYFGSPLINENKITGLISVMDVHPMEITPLVKPLLGIFSARIAMELENKRLYDSLEETILKRTQELRHAKEIAEKASLAKTEFLSRMSHELRTPLNAVLGFAQLLDIDEDPSLSSNQQDHVAEIINAGRHLLDLINEVLDLARIESGKFELDIVKAPIAPIIDECMRLTKPLADSRNINIQKTVDHNNSYIHVDRVRLKQIIINLLSNAIKFNQDQGNVSIQVEPINNEKIRINIIDTGPGIPEQLHDDIFNPFIRHDQSSIEGTGIGLSVAKQLTELMQGNIGISSQPKKGSTFWIEFKVAP